jgi:hypothetical protein
MKRWFLFAALLLVATPAAAQLQAPNERATVAAVKAAHPEVNTCDEVARGQVVDWTAQRLNTRDGQVRWGRKGKTATGSVSNTDALTFKRTDGLFEIYDVISGGAPCNASWQAPTRALKPGENGFWVPPQLGPEPGTGTNVPPPPPPPPPPASEAATAELQRQQLALLLQIVQQLQAQNEALARAVSELKTQIADGVKLKF